MLEKKAAWALILRERIVAVMVHYEAWLDQLGLVNDEPQRHLGVSTGGGSMSGHGLGSYSLQD